MLIDIQKIDFQKHLLFTSAPDIQHIIRPFNQFGIYSFCYQRLDPDRGMIHLASDPILEELFIREQLYLHALCAPYDQYTTGYYLGDCIEHHPEFVAALKARQIWYYLVIVKRNQKNTEIFFFGSKPNLSPINHFYLNHMDILEKFILQFKNTAKSIIFNYHNQRLLYPDGNDRSCLTNQRVRKKFILVHNFDSLASLTKRENECLKYLRQGYTAKMIARDLDVSHRTIEHHLRHIRDKFGGVSIQDMLIQMRKT